MMPLSSTVVSDAKGVASKPRAPTLSAVLVAHNEEAQLADCLATLTFADEIVVLLDRCTDRSQEIARGFTDRIVEGAWPREAARRSAAVAACRSDWIIEADADERIGRELAAEIRAVIAQSTASWHLVPIDNYVGRRLVRWGWGAYAGRSAHAALFRNGVKSWKDDRVLHASAELTGMQGPRLKAGITHYVDKSITDMIQRLNRYTSLRASDLRRSGNIGTFGGNLRRMVTRFWKSFVGRKGYREGHYGFLIALFAALYPILSYLKARYEDE
jgi:glycosyltransferase involved in cell wall biosynthesis